MKDQLKENWKLLIGLVLVAAGGAVWFIYRRGKKDAEARLRQTLLALPSGGKGLTAGYDEKAARQMAESINRIINGVFVSGAAKMAAFGKLDSLSDDELAYTSNVYTLTYDEPLVKALTGEWFAFGELGDLRDKLIRRLSGMKTQ